MDVADLYNLTSYKVRYPLVRSKSKKKILCENRGNIEKIPIDISELYDNYNNFKYCLFLCS